MQKARIALALACAVLGLVLALAMFGAGSPAGIVLSLGGLIMAALALRVEDATWRIGARLALGIGVLGAVISLVAMVLFFGYLMGAEEQGELVTETRLEAWSVERNGEQQVRLRLHGISNDTSVPFDGWVHYRFIDSGGDVAFESNLTIDYDRFWGEPRTYTWHLDGAAIYPDSFSIIATVGVDATGNTYEHAVGLVWP